MTQSFCFVLVFFSIVSCQSSKLVEEQAPISLTINEKDLSLEELKQIATPVKVTVHEAHLNTPIEYLAFPMVALLNSQFGEEWKKSDGILFTALDGYRSDVSIEKILKYKPLLAFSFADESKAFKIDNKAQNEKDVELGPYYLIWDNIRNAELKRTGAYGWPYQVDQIDRIQYASYYAKAFPIKNPTPDHKKGFELFKTYCMSCHSVSGEEGGAKGPALYPNPGVIQRGYSSFRKWTQSPSKVKAGTTMPPLNTNLTAKERDEVSSLIYKYLIALNKK
ncbi:MAG: cytochrome c [Bdellovibrionota bacterium]